MCFEGIVWECEWHSLAGCSDHRNEPSISMKGEEFNE